MVAFLQERLRLCKNRH